MQAHRKISTNKHTRMEFFYAVRQRQRNIAMIKINAFRKRFFISVYS